MVEEKISKELLIENYCSYRVSQSAILDEHIARTEKYLEKEYDEDIALILHAFKFLKVDDDNEGYEKLCIAAVPIFQLLDTADLLESLWVIVASTVIGYYQNFKKSLELFKKTITTISKKEYMDIPRYRNLTITLRYNMTSAILDIIEHEKNQDINILKDTFKQCYDYVIKVCEGKENLLLRKYILQVRYAILEKDCEQLESKLIKLIKLGDKHDKAYQTSKAQAIKLLPRMGDKLSKPLINILIGHNIKMRRLEQGMSIEDLADAIDAEPSNIYAMERGSEGVSLVRLNKICYALKVDAGYLFGKDNQVQKVDPVLHNLSAIMSKLTDEQKKLILKSVKATVGAIKIQSKR